MKLRWISACVLAFFSINSSMLYATAPAQSTPQPTAAQVNQNWQVLTDKIRKSQRDHRDYRAIQLDNGMRVLLVSDPKAVKSLAALALPVGSLHNPEKQQGLAHYLEHMILMGSKKYPQPHEFSEFLSKNAGSYNASTAAFRTSYYFEVANTAFQPALDRLADAIAQPLFDPKNSDKERNAVNAELTMARSRDGMRMQQVNAETIHPSHPASQFFGGNLETLSDKPDSQLHPTLLDFYQRYYSANLMVAVLYSNQDLDQLAQLAAGTFGQIENRHVHVDAIEIPAVTEKENGLAIHYVPAQPFRALMLNFAIDNNLADFKQKTDEYLGYLISNRSPNTLADWLQKQGYIEDIAGVANPIRYGNSGNFTISVELTEKGEKHREEVIAAIFAYLDLVRQKGIEPRYFSEIQKVLDLSFLYADIHRNMRYVESLTDYLLLYPVEHALDADFVAERFDAKAIEHRLADLQPNNMRLWYIGPNEPHNKEAYFVGAKYEIEKLSPSKIKQWQTKAKQFNFQLPVVNPYIPTDFTLKNQQPASEMKPKMVLNEAGKTAYFLPSYYFADEPKTALVVGFENLNAIQTAKEAVMLSLMDYLAGKSLDLLQYQASIGGVSLSVSVQNGLKLQASGFSQHLPALTQAMIQGYQTFQVTEAGLEQAKSWYRQRLDESEHVKAFELALQPVKALSQIPYFEKSLRRQQLAAIFVADLNAYRDQFFKQTAVSMMATGNITEQETRQLTTQLYQQIGSEQTSQATLPMITINQAVPAQLSKLGPSTDSALAQVFVPANQTRIKSLAYSRVLSKILHPWFFDQLRTQEQLGYVVSSFPASISRQSGLAFLVQSNNQDPNYLQTRFQAFYQQAEQKLTQLTEDEVTQYTQGVLMSLTEQPQTLGEELATYLGDFSWHDTDFESKSQLIEAVKNIKKADLIAFFKQAVTSPTGLVLSSRIVGQDHKEKAAKSAEALPLYEHASQLQHTLLKQTGDKP